MTHSLKVLRLSLVAAGLAVAAPSFAAVTPLCGDHEKGADSKEKSEKKEKDVKKPSNPA